MAQGTAEQQRTQEQHRAGSACYTLVSQRGETPTYDRERSPEYDRQYRAGSTTLLMQTTPREGPAPESQPLSFDYYRNQLASIARQIHTSQQHEEVVIPQRPDGQQSPADQQQDVDFAIQQYLRMLLREQTKRIRDMECK